ncbi:hypothetical protein LI170_16575, partial [Desulfovibrio desulfuricans]
ELKQKGIQIISTFHQIPKAHRKIFLRTTSAYAYAFPLSKRKDILDRELQRPVYLPSCGS